MTDKLTKQTAIINLQEKIEKQTNMDSEVTETTSWISLSVNFSFRLLFCIIRRHQWQ